MLRSLSSLALLPGCLLWRGGDDRCARDQTWVIASQADVSHYAGCNVAREIRIETTPIGGIEQIELAALISVAGTITVRGNHGLHGLYLPRLERAGGIEVADNDELTTLAVPKLTGVTGGFVVTGNHDLELIAAEELVSVGKALVIAGQPKLTLLEMGKLAHAETLRLDADPGLPPEVVEQLRAKTAIP